MVLLDLASTTWMPLILTGITAVLMFVLYKSMRREIGKIDVPHRADQFDGTPDSDAKEQPR